MSDTQFGDDMLFNGSRHTLFFVGKGYMVGTTLDGIIGVAHCNARPRQLQHGYVADTVAEGYHFLRLHLQRIFEERQGIALIHGRRHYFQKEGFGKEDICHTVQPLFPMGVQVGQHCIVIADKHIFMGSRPRKILCTGNAHLVQRRFCQDMGILRCIRNNQIICVGKYGNAAFLRLLVHVRNRFCIQLFLEQNLSALCVQYLPPVVRHDKPTVLVHLQRFRNR
ncbi:hypothetical protein Barb7_00930 [Bacteroidales bacterium Barb7]|nr:hypothetical protein Barb7_00930 [Bacteroidales bacterium Barb7]